MSKAYEMISESLNEIIDDLEKNDGKNLKRENLKREISSQKKIAEASMKIFEKNREAYRILANS